MTQPPVGFFIANSAASNPISEGVEINCELGPDRRAGVKSDAAAHYTAPSSLE